MGNVLHVLMTSPPPVKPAHAFSTVTVPSPAEFDDIITKTTAAAAPANGRVYVLVTGDRDAATGKSCECTLSYMLPVKNWVYSQTMRRRHVWVLFGGVFLFAEHSRPLPGYCHVVLYCKYTKIVGVLWRVDAFWMRRGTAIEVPIVGGFETASACTWK